MHTRGRPHRRFRVLLAGLALLVAAATAFWMLTHNNGSTAAQILSGTVSSEAVEESFAGPGVIAPAAPRDVIRMEQTVTQSV